MDSPTVLPLPALAWCLLPELGLILAEGPEARSFLQGQLSNDMASVSATQSQLSGYCSAKGRLLAVFTVQQLGAEQFGLSLPLSLLPATLKRLKMFVLRSKLTLSDASALRPALALLGNEAPAQLSAFGLPAPVTAWKSTSLNDVSVLRRPGDTPRFLLHVSPERLVELQSQLAKLAPPDEQAWALSELFAGLPLVLPATADHYVPQTANLDLAGGVSFAKGCYPGQEIVARVHYLGRLKQRLHLSFAATAAEPGTSVFVADGNGQAVGEVMAAATMPNGSSALSLVLQLAHSNSPDLRLGSSQGPALQAPMLYQNP